MTEVMVPEVRQVCAVGLVCCTDRGAALICHVGVEGGVVGAAA